MPWFAFEFIITICFNSLNLLPDTVVDGINYANTFFLTMAMTALGMNPDFRKFKESGIKSFILSLILFLWLMLGGFIVKCI